MPKASTTPEVGRAIKQMLRDCGIESRVVEESLGRGQSTVWAWMNRGTSDFQAIAALEDLCGLPRGEVGRRCDGPGGRPYVEAAFTVEQAIESEPRLLPHIRKIALEMFMHCVYLSDEERRARGDGDSISRAS